ncbi:MAG: helix-turn-helix domain-containing protein [Flavobacteriaceae bacterium]|jgi:DNA-binding HxlR family transcriptional regulator
MNNSGFRSHCALATGLDIIGDKWSLLIVRDLFEGKKTFTEMRLSKEGVATNILADRLKNLSHHGVISFYHAADNRKTKYYFLTAKGMELYTIQLEVMRWSSKYYPEQATDHPVFLEQLANSTTQKIAKTHTKTYEQNHHKHFLKMNPEA